MTPVEVAELRDKVARARLSQFKAIRENKRAWNDARMAAGDAALAALRNAEQRRRKPLPLRERCVYCGIGVRPRRRPDWVPATCVKHRDLPRLDPFYVERAA